MEKQLETKRKRVTRVGSGAFSIYLPKKWIDSWPPQQQESREVDLIPINESLLIVPAHLQQHFELNLEPSENLVCQALQSAYVRGADQLLLSPREGEFLADTIAAARDLLRHLDERLIVTSTPSQIGFSLDPSLQPGFSNAAELLRVMSAKMREMTTLCKEAVDTHLIDHDRSLHAMSLLVRTQEEDVRRLFHQALRMVAKLELPMQSVSEFQSLDLLAADMERLGSHMVRICEILLADLGLTVADLAYPRAHLLEKISSTPAATVLVRQLVRNYDTGFDAVLDHLQLIMEAVHSADVPELGRLKESLIEQQEDIAQRFFATFAEHWGAEITAEDAAGLFSMTRVASVLADLAHVLQSVCHHALILTAPTSMEGAKA